MMAARVVAPMLVVLGFVLIAGGALMSSLAHSARGDITLILVSLVLQSVATIVWALRGTRRRIAVGAIGLLECVIAAYWFIAAPVTPGAAPDPGEVPPSLTSYSSIGLLGSGLALFAASAVDPRRREAESRLG